MRAPARIGLLALLGACLLCTLPAAIAGAEVTYDFSFGSAGSTPVNPYPLLEPIGVAVDKSSGNVYVADTGNERIEEFDADGNFIRMWGKGVNQTTGGGICPIAPSDVCQPGTVGQEAGEFNIPEGIGVDNSSGPAAGSVYVQDSGNNRVQRFSADGQFVLMWGKNVDQQTSARICPEHPGDTCQAGLTSGVPEDRTKNPPIPPIPSEDGVFAGWSGESTSSAGKGPNLAVDDAGFIYAGDPIAVPFPRIQKFSSDGAFVGKVAPAPAQEHSITTGQRILNSPKGTAVGPDGRVYVSSGPAGVVSFAPDDFTLAGEGTFGTTYGSGAHLNEPAVDPSNGFIFGLGSDCFGVPGRTGTHIVEYHPSSQEVDCTVPTAPTVPRTGTMALSPGHRLYITDPSVNAVRVFTTLVASPPDVVSQSAAEITATGVRFNAQIAANLGDTTYHVEYGTSPCSEVPDPCSSTPESTSIGAAFAPQPVNTPIHGLDPQTLYYFRVVAHNSAGTDIGADRRFSTFATGTFDPSCANNLARQQTGAAFLLDCRAYELVSAEDQGGYDVESDLFAGQDPYGGYPAADGRALYAVHNGGIPGAGNSTNRGPDPYLAVRDEANQRWDTTYVGVPASAPSLEPFSSTLAGSSANLSAFAFGGPEICSPCFANGTAGIPLRLPDGKLVQGMAGPVPVSNPIPAGEVAKPLSGNGTHFVFGSKQLFVNGGNDDGTNATIYDRNLSTGKTQVVSLDHGEPIKAGTGVAELDISSDGSRILIGSLVATEGENDYWHLYMHVGNSVATIDLTPGAPDGVLYDGMTADGARVYFTTRDALSTAADQDTDTSADLYRADVSSSAATLIRVSAVPGESSGGAGDTDTCDPAGNSYNDSDWNVPPAGPTDCSAVAVGGGGGVASTSGAIYFLSPEQLDGSEGEAGAPNLYRVRPGQAPRFVATLESSAHAPLKPVAHPFKGSFGSFSLPEGTAIDHASGSTYVLDTIATTDAQTPGAFVQKFDASGEPDLAFGENSKLFGSNSGPFLEAGAGFFGSPTGLPTQIAVDNSGGGSNGSLYVPDFGNGTLDKFAANGHFLTKFSTSGGGFGTPLTGVAVRQTNGHVYATSTFSNLVYHFNQNGIAQAGSPFSVTGPALGLAVDSSGNVYVANANDTRLYNSTGAFVKVLDPNPSYGVSVDPADDHVYVDGGNHVTEYDAAGVKVGEFGGGVISESVSLAADSGRLAISNPGRGRYTSYGPAAVPPDSGYDNPLVIDSVREAGVRHTADFQTNAGGEQAVFPSAIALTGFENAGRYEIFRYDTAVGTPQCVSCSPTEAEPTSDASLASDGLSLTDDGRVFFTTGEPLVLRDANGNKDAYEWKGNRAELISSGISRFDSGLLSATADGTDAFFFTRETLAPNDGNGELVKLYDARAGGGVFPIAPPPQCRASDECHGPGSQAAPQGQIGTDSGKGGQYPPPRCKRPKVRRRGRCVRPPHHRNHRRHSGQRSTHHG